MDESTEYIESLLAIIGQLEQDITKLKAGLKAWEDRWDEALEQYDGKETT